MTTNHTGPVIEFSDGFDAVGWYTEIMSRPDYDPYYDEGDY
jgi:hypothetical protein